MPVSMGASGGIRLPCSIPPRDDRFNHIIYYIDNLSVLDEAHFHVYHEKAKKKLQSAADILLYKAREAADGALNRAEAAIGRKGH
jgi:hypothetical protein